MAYSPSSGLRPPSPSERRFHYKFMWRRKALAQRPFSPGEKVPDRADEGGSPLRDGL